MPEVLIIANDILKMNHYFISLHLQQACNDTGKYLRFNRKHGNFWLLSVVLFFQLKFFIRQGISYVFINNYKTIMNTRANFITWKYCFWFISYLCNRYFVLRFYLAYRKFYYFRGWNYGPQWWVSWLHGLQQHYVTQSGYLFFESMNVYNSMES